MNIFLQLDRHCSNQYNSFTFELNMAYTIFIHKTNRTYQLCRENSHFGGQPHGLIEADREIE